MRRHLLRQLIPPALALLLVFVPRVAAQEKSLADRLQPLARAHRGKVAIAVKHLETGEAFYWLADTVMPTASLIKFAIMLEAYQQVADGRLKLSDPVTLREADKVPGSGILTYHFSDGATFPLRDAVRLMMVYSDNTATNLVLDRTGIAAVNQRMAAWGCPETRVNAKVFRGKTTSIDRQRTTKYGLGSTTARETVSLLERLHRGKLVNAKACLAMIDHMKHCDDREKLKRFLPKEVTVAHKSGTVSTARTDAGILYFKSGPVAICVLTAENGDRSWKSDNAANVLIGRVAQEVHQYFVEKNRTK